MAEIKVSLLVPAYNEQLNIAPLLEETDRFLREQDLSSWELVLVDDGSDDGTYDAAMALRGRYPFLTVLRHPKNSGKTEALLTAARAARGGIFVIYDADLQYRLEDAQKLVEKLEREDYDLVAGCKTGFYEKKFVSQVYNLFSRWLFRISVHDMNAMKSLRREVLLDMQLRKDWHRYIIPLAQERGARIGEERVRLLRRRHGKSKYSSSLRILGGFLDLISVKLRLTFMGPPRVSVRKPRPSGIVSRVSNESPYPSPANLPEKS